MLLVGKEVDKNCVTWKTQENQILKQMDVDLYRVVGQDLAIKWSLFGRRLLSRRSDSGYQLAATRVFQFILAATADCELLVMKS